MYKKIISSLLFISISCLLLATNNPRYEIHNLIKIFKNIF